MVRQSLAFITRKGRLLSSAIFTSASGAGQSDFTSSEKFQRLRLQGDLISRNPPFFLADFASQIRTRVPPLCSSSPGSAQRRRGSSLVPAGNSSTLVSRLASANGLVVMVKRSPSIKLEKNPIPYLPVDSKPLEASPGCSDIISADPQYDLPKSRNGPVSTSFDIPIPLSSISNHSPFA